MDENENGILDGGDSASDLPKIDLDEKKKDNNANQNQEEKEDNGNDSFASQRIDFDNRSVEKIKLKLIVN